MKRAGQGQLLLSLPRLPSPPGLQESRSGGPWCMGVLDSTAGWETPTALTREWTSVQEGAPVGVVTMEDVIEELLQVRVYPLHPAPSNLPLPFLPPNFRSLHVKGGPFISKRRDRLSVLGERPVKGDCTTYPSPLFPAVSHQAGIPHVRGSTEWLADSDTSGFGRAGAGRWRSMTKPMARFVPARKSPARGWH